MPEEDAFLEILRPLVELETPSGHGERLRRGAELLRPPLEKAGADVEIVDAGEAGAHLRARIGGREEGEPLLLLGHLDTVHPVGTLQDFPFRLDEERISGPGTYDMKGPVAAVVTALGLMAREGRAPRTGAVLLLTCDEEVGSDASRPHIDDEARRARGALVLEPPVPGGDCKVRRKGTADFTLTVRGVPAHAGVEPGEGASAVVEAARLVLRVVELADPGRGTTLNPGIIRGGTATNVVAPSATLRLDVRFRNPDEVRRVEGALRALEPVDGRCRIEVSGGVSRPPLAPTPESERLLERARGLARAVGIELEGGETGGASDGNLTAALGCPTLDGLGIDGAGAHTLDEAIFRDDVPRRIRLYRRLLEEL